MTEQPPPPPAAPPPAGAQPPLSEADQRLWATLAHIGGILISFIAGLIVWLVFRERGAFVEEQSKEALNFQITIAIGYVAATILSPLGIGLIIFPLVGLAALIFGIIAAIAANKGEHYRYPFAIRLIK